MQPIDSPPAPSRASTDLLSNAHTAAEATYLRGQAKGERNLPPGWSEIVHTGNLGNDMKTADAMHLKAPNGQEFVAFRGTKEGKDWKDNALQAVGTTFGLKSDKYQAAARIGDAMRKADVTFTGHSLGGGLAKLSAEVASTGPNGAKADSKLCVSFNGAPVAPATYRMNGCKPKNHNRETVHVVNEYDALNRFVKGGKAHAFTGNTISSREGQNTMLVHAKGGGNIRGASGHGLKAFDTQQPPGGRPAKFTAQIFDTQGQSMQHGALDTLVRTPVRDPAARAQLMQAGHHRTQGREMTQDRGGRS